MAIKINVNGIAKEFSGGRINVNGSAKEIQQVWSNVGGVAKLVWENWKLKTGNLYAMTANSWNGFVASGSGTIPYKAFDNNVDTDNGNSDGEHLLNLNFPKPIKIQSMWIRGATGSGNRNMNIIIRIKLASGSYQDVFTQSYGGNLFDYNQTINLNSNIEAYGIQIYHKGHGTGGYGMKEVQITKWYEKG